MVWTILALTIGSVLCIVLVIRAATQLDHAQVFEGRRGATLATTLVPLMTAGVTWQWTIHLTPIGWCVTWSILLLVACAGVIQLWTRLYGGW